jgi:hypothetical protein
MIFSAARLHGRASSRPESYMVDDQDDNVKAAAAPLQLSKPACADGSTTRDFVGLSEKTCSLWLQKSPGRKFRENSGNSLNFSKAFPIGNVAVRIP